jgi:hypothetical protein
MKDVKLQEAGDRIIKIEVSFKIPNFLADFEIRR